MNRVEKSGLIPDRVSRADCLTCSWYGTPVYGGGRHGHQDGHDDEVVDVSSWCGCEEGHVFHVRLSTKQPVEKGGR